jgi:hypothetical protein
VTINEHATDFAGKPVVDWDPETGIEDPTGTIYRITLSYDEAEDDQVWTDKLALFLDDPASSQVVGIVVGEWEEAYEDGSSQLVVEALVAARDRLPNLRAIFLGDMTYEECEISWIVQTDVSPLFDAYPALEHFCVRGTNSLSLGRLQHDRLLSLTVQSGGLDAEHVRAVGAARLPALEHLELWLGTENYGGNTTVEDLAPILGGAQFPKLRYLGLRDSEIADEIAAALAQAPVLERIRVLDLSLGTLSDTGAAALLTSPALARLEKLDIHYHYCSPELVAQLQGLGIEVDASDAREDEEDDGEVWRYVAVSE